MYAIIVLVSTYTCIDVSHYLYGLLARLVLDEGDLVIEIEVKVLEGTMLEAQRLQGGAVYLGGEVPGRKTIYQFIYIFPKLA